MEHGQATRYIFLDPDGTQEFGLVVIVAAATGVAYAHQCGGLSTLVRALEGFAVPLGGPTAAQPLRSFFSKHFHGNPPAMDTSEDAMLGAYWTSSQLSALDSILSTIRFWITYPPNMGLDDQPGVLRLDRTRLTDLTEAWIPVVTPYGPGVLVFANSD